MSKNNDRSGGQGFLSSRTPIKDAVSWQDVEGIPLGPNRRKFVVLDLKYLGQIPHDYEKKSIKFLMIKMLLFSSLRLLFNIPSHDNGMKVGYFISLSERLKSKWLKAASYLSLVDNSPIYKIG